MTGPLLRFRVMAYVVGVWLLALLFVAMPLKYFADQPAVSAVVAPVHGFLYIGYLGVGFDLARRAGWALERTVLVLLAGTIPFLSFVVERRISRELSAAA